MANYDLGTIGYTVQNTGAPKSIDELKQLAQAGIEVYRSGEKLSKAQERLNQHFASIDKQITNVNRNIQKHSGYLNQAAQQSNRFGVATQQVGYQVGDFLVQVQSGTNWMVAFGQQATQLVGILPLLEGGFMGLSGTALVALSAGLGIAIPLITAIGAAWMRTGEETEKGTDRVSDAANSLKADIEKLELDNIKVRFNIDSDSVAKAKREIITAQLEIAKIQRESFAPSSIAMLGGSQFSQVGAWEQDQKERVDAQNEIIKGLEEQLFILDAQEEAQRMLNGHLSTAKGIQAAAAADKWAELQTAKELEAATANALQVYAKTRAEGEALADAASKAGVSAAQLSHLDFSNIATASSYALQLAGNLGISLDTANKLAALGPQGIGGNDPSGKVYGGRGAAPTQGQIVEQRLAGSIGYFTPPKPGKTKRGGGGGGKGQTQEEYIQELIREDEQKRKLIGISQEEQTASEREFKVREKLRDLKGGVTEAEIQATLRQMDATQKLIEQENRREAIISSASKTIEGAFMSMVDGSKSVADAFKGMIRDILLNVYRQQVAAPIGDMLSGALRGVFQANGGAWNNGIQMFANGGVVGSPTMFGHSGGLGIMGEAGPEAIMPLKRGKNGKLGVQVDGGSGGVVVTNNITVTGSDAAMVRVEIAKMIPQITNATKSAIIDAKQRGGQMGAAFR